MADKTICVDVLNNPVSVWVDKYTTVLTETRYCHLNSSSLYTPDVSDFINGRLEISFTNVWSTLFLNDLVTKSLKSYTFLVDLPNNFMLGWWRGSQRMNHPDLAPVTIRYFKGPPRLLRQTPGVEPSTR